jgi:Ferritin-like domain
MPKTPKTNPLEMAYEAVDREYSGESAHTRRQLVGAAALGIGGLAAASVPGVAMAAGSKRRGSNDPQTILNIAATAEVLATIVNTVGPEKVDLDKVTRKNVQAAAYEELIHFNVLDSLGGVPVSKMIWVPNAVFKNKTSLLETLEVGDQIFINAYLIATTVFGDAGEGTTARYTAEFMGVEAVHRALARQSLGKLGNDRAFMKYDDVEQAKGAPNKGTAGFTDINVAAQQLQAAGFGFGEEGSSPGKFYDFDQVKNRTPQPGAVNQLTVD